MKLFSDRWSCKYRRMPCYFIPASGFLEIVFFHRGGTYPEFRQTSNRELFCENNYDFKPLAIVTCRNAFKGNCSLDWTHLNILFCVNICDLNDMSNPRHHPPEICFVFVLNNFWTFCRLLKCAEISKLTEISCSKLPNFIRVGCVVNQFDLSLPRKNSKKHVSSRVITKAHTYLALLTLSWRRLLSCRNQSIDLQRKWMDWFLYERALRHERVKNRRRVAQCHWKFFTLLIYLSD